MSEVKIVKQLNEDKHGIINDENQQFNSIEEAYNYVKTLKSKLKRKASMEEFPISCAMPEDRMKYIKYSLSLMTKQNLPFADMRKVHRAKCVVWGVALGYTYQALMGYLRKQGFNDVTIKKLKEIEAEGMRFAKQAIDRVRNTKSAIVGGA